MNNHQNHCATSIILQTMQLSFLILVTKDLTKRKGTKEKYTPTSSSRE